MALPNFLTLGYVNRLIRGATVNEPSSDEKAALVGTSGIPSATNRFVTEEDPQYANGVTQAGSIVVGHLAVFASDKVIEDGGEVPTSGGLTPVVGEPFTGDGVTVAFVLATAPTAGTVAVYQNGVRQTPTSAFTVTGATVTFVTAPAFADELLIDSFHA